MRRLARWTLNALIVMSLLLCVAAAALWVRSYAICDDFAVGRTRELASDQGQLIFAWGQRGEGKRDWHWAERPGAELWFFDIMTTNAASLLRAPGVWVASIPSHHWTVMIVRHGLVVAASLTAPASVAGFSLLRRRRHRAGWCPSCSYDLTGNVSGVRPECGIAVSRSALGETLSNARTIEGWT